MQVYELMNQLKDLPAGAEVMVDTLVSANAFERMDFDEEGDKYVVFFPVKGVENCDNYIGLS